MHIHFVNTTHTFKNLQASIDGSSKDTRFTADLNTKLDILQAWNIYKMQTIKSIQSCTIMLCVTAESGRRCLSALPLSMTVTIELLKNDHLATSDTPATTIWSFLVFLMDRLFHFILVKVIIFTTKWITIKMN